MPDGGLARLAQGRKGKEFGRRRAKRMIALVESAATGGDSEPMTNGLIDAETIKYYIRKFRRAQGVWVRQRKGQNKQ